MIGDIILVGCIVATAVGVSLTAANVSAALDDLREVRRLVEYWVYDEGYQSSAPDMIATLDAWQGTERLRATLDRLRQDGVKAVEAEFGGGE